MSEYIEDLKKEYIELSKKQQEHIKLATTLSKVSVARQMLIKTMSSNTERLGQLAKFLRSVGIDPDTL